MTVTRPLWELTGRAHDALASWRRARELAARDVKPGRSWAFKCHRSMAQVEADDMADRRSGIRGSHLAAHQLLAAQVGRGLKASPGMVPAEDAAGQTPVGSATCVSSLNSTGEALVSPVLSGDL